MFGNLGTHFMQHQNVAFMSKNIEYAKHKTNIASLKHLDFSPIVHKIA